MIPITKWDIEDIGPVEGLLDSSSASPVTIAAVNNSGIVAGHAPVGTGTHGFYIDGSTVTDFTPAGADAVDVQDINADGMIVGGVRLPPGPKEAFLWKPPGIMVKLTGLGGTETTAAGISKVGTITGHHLMGTGIRHALRWGPPLPDISTVPVSLHEAGYSSTAGYSINEAGTIAGIVKEPSWPSMHAIHGGTGWIPITQAHAHEPSHPHINAGGSVSGVITAGGLSFLYDQGVVTQLSGFPTILHPHFGREHGLSDATDMVGEGWRLIPPNLTEITATILFKGIVYDLNQFIAQNSGWRLESARAISPNGGYIAGSGTLWGQRRIFRLRRNIVHVRTWRIPEVPHEWPFWILGGKLDEGAVKIGPAGPMPMPIPPWTGSAGSITSAGMSEALRMLALHELTTQIQDPELRRKIQPLLMKAVIEQLKAIEEVSAVEGKIRRIKVRRAPSKVETND